MSILSKMSKLFKIVTSDTKSSDIEISKLLQYSKINIPIEFLEIIKEQSELEICVNNEKYIRVWGANGCIEMNEDYHIQKYIPNSLAIGDDECSNAILYSNGNNGFGVYIVSFGDLGVDEMVYIADSLEDFFVNEVGVDVFNIVYKLQKDTNNVLRNILRCI